ncbi:hypothetical protein ID866_10598 [Astraeus odoratus]|nr:hypothetical protein ID866_10598 [Astraeus odoratus]
MWNQDLLLNEIIAARVPSMSEEVREQPSAYLHAHCPLCFGASNWRKIQLHDRVDCIICIDVCFTQKHLKNPCGSQGYDPLNPTDSIFILIEDVTAMEAHVQFCQSRKEECG